MPDDVEIFFSSNSNPHVFTEESFDRMLSNLQNNAAFRAFVGKYTVDTFPSLAQEDSIIPPD